MYNSHSPLENHFLAALPTSVQSHIFPHLELIALPLGKTLYESGDVIRYVYFPTCAIVSLLCMLENGSSTELALIGNEGVIGTNLLLGSNITNDTEVVLTAGYAYRLLGHHIKEEFLKHTDVSSLVLRYTQSLMAQIAQGAACNQHHTIEQQLARWLLTLFDRLPSNHLTMTHESIANMLGVRREGITAAAGKFQKMGIISYSRGHIHVLDTAKLEQLSCECYEAVKNEMARLLPYMNHFATPQDHGPIANKNIANHKNSALCPECSHYPCSALVSNEAVKTISNTAYKTQLLQN